MNTKTDVNLNLPAICPQCEKYTSHLHYSSWHEFSAKFGVGIVLVALVIAFVSGAVKGSTQLYLDSSTFQTYQFVYGELNKLLAPYQYLVYLSAIWELAYVILGVTLIATLNSWRGKLHLITAILTPLFVVLDMATSYYYTILSQEAMARLPAIILSSDMLNVAAQTDMKFEAAYGFWGTPSNLVRGLLNLIGLITLLVAVVSCRVTYSFQPSKTEEKVQVSIPSPDSSQTVPSPNRQSEGINYKFCRYCGVRIPRESKFCEECGKSL